MSAGQILRATENGCGLTTTSRLYISSERNTTDFVGARVVNRSGARQRGKSAQIRRSGIFAATYGLGVTRHSSAI
jgi:hypothetical protein